MNIDCIGCLHGSRPKLLGGDLLFITGDLTARDKPSEWDDFLNWIEDQKYKKKIMIAGNHDNTLQNCEKNFFEFIKQYGIEYLSDSGTEFEGLKIWGSPWIKTFKDINPKCQAFTKKKEIELKKKWEQIPSDIDILITHSPPYSILDGIPIEDGSLFHVGSPSLFDKIASLPNIKLHAFSHIHEAHGFAEYESPKSKMIVNYVNCSIMNERYKPVNAPIRIIL